MTSLSIPTRGRVLAVMLLAALVARAESAARYEAVFFDGTRIEGENVSGWGEHPVSPRLDNTPLSDAKRPLRWLRDRSGRPWRPNGQGSAYIEFVGGDRLVGRIVGAESDDLQVPAHLLVQPATLRGRSSRRPPASVRVLPGRIERVVFEPSSRRQLTPGILYYRGGRILGFIGLRWQDNSVVLLLKEDTREVKTSEISEVHLPRIDPWQAYYRELATLSPACRSRMVRIETNGGLIATGSSLWFGALPYATDAHQQAAVAHLERLDKQIASIADKRKANQLKLNQAREKYDGQLAESEEQKKATREAHQKAEAEMRKGIDKLRKADSAEWTKRREKLDREFRAADQAMVTRLGPEPPEKRDRKLETFRAKQAKLRKSRAKSLEGERLKLEAQRKNQLHQFISAQTRKLEHLAKELDKQVAARKRQLKTETRRWEAFLRSIESVKAQRASARGADGTVDTWHHILQPVWSLDPLRVQFTSIHTRWSFAPQEVPLCRVRPASRLSPPFLPGRTNRNSAGLPLRSGADEYAWGFAVHAYSELRFSLPKCATAFRTRIGLDSVVGAGGCARGRVYIGSTSGKCAYESPLLVGSEKTVDTGRISLGLPPAGPRLLVLQADPAERDCPPGADPLNIRDKLDWLDPHLELDKPALVEQVSRQIGPVLAASSGWTVRLERRGVYNWTSRLDTTPTMGVRRFCTMLQVRRQPLTIRREMKVGPADKWLAVHVSLSTGENPQADVVALRVGERKVQPRAVPVRQLWQGRPAPLLFGLEEYQGKKITLELSQPAGGKPLHWQGVSTLAAAPPAYRLADIMKLIGKNDMQVPYHLGQALQSSRIAKAEKLVALEINQLGGRVNFRPPDEDKGSPSRLADVMLGANWTGGDKTFIKAVATFRKLPGLETLVATGDSGVSDGAIAKLQAEMPELTVTRVIKRTPSHRKGGWVRVTWRNLTDKNVAILYVGPECKLRFSRYLKPGQVLRLTSNEGSRLEAHYLRKDFTSAEQYSFSLPLTTSQSTLGAVWDIRPVGK